MHEFLLRFKQKARRILGQYKQPAVIKLLIVGFTVLAASLFLKLPEKWESRLEHLGLLLVATAIVTPILNDSFERWIKRSFGIVDDAARADILRIFERRSAAYPSIMEKVTQATEKIEILAIAGTTFLRPGTDEEKGPTFLTELERRICSGAPLNVQILLVDPRSAFATERSDREDEEPLKYPNNNLCRDILNGVSQIEALLAGCKSNRGVKLEGRLTNDNPVTMYIRVDNRIYFETFTTGIPKNQAQHITTKCLGKAVPVLEIAADSEAGHIYQSHFKHLWDESGHAVIQIGSHAEITSQLKEGLWYDYHWKRRQEEIGLLTLSRVTQSLEDEAAVWP